MMELQTKINRYSRQMLVPQIGSQGQDNLTHSTVAVVGAGGIGSTVLMYLAGAGIGHLKLIDHDIVDESNLHRQIIHSTESVGVAKVQSAKQRLLSLNPHIDIVTHESKLTCDNAIALLHDADVVVDATDSHEVRYILNDCCVLLGIPLVTGSAVSLEGQITVIIPKQTPCYRCIYPVPSFQDTCRSCDNAGVLGPVPGLIGCLEAIETIKLLSNKNRDSNRGLAFDLLTGRQFFYDGLNGSSHNFNLPQRKTSCVSCGDTPTIATMVDSQSNLDEMKANISCSTNSSKSIILDQSQQITCDEFSKLYFNNIPHVLLDVRSAIQHDMISLEKFYSNPSNSPAAIVSSSSINCKFIHSPLRSLRTSNDMLSQLKQQTDVPIFVMCRRGVDSVTATQYLLDNGLSNVRNIIGGINAWKREVDDKFPAY